MRSSRGNSDVRRVNVLSWVTSTVLDSNLTLLCMRTASIRPTLTHEDRMISVSEACCDRSYQELHLSNRDRCQISPMTKTGAVYPYCGKGGDSKWPDFSYGRGSMEGIGAARSASPTWYLASIAYNENLPSEERGHHSRSEERRKLNENKERKEPGLRILRCMMAL